MWDVGHDEDGLRPVQAVLNNATKILKKYGSINAYKQAKFHMGTEAYTI